MKIITLTLNPAFDTHCQTETFLPFRENFAAISASHAGGKGINLSRALSYNGTPNTAVVVLGEENGDGFLHQLKDIDLHLHTIRVPGRIRENLTLHSDGGRETRISFGGFPASTALLSRLANILSAETDRDTVLTVTGSNPEGLPKELFKEILHTLSDNGVKLVIDSRSFDLDDLTELQPWLIKPNQEEISRYLGQEIDCFSQVLSAAQSLHHKGIANVMVSLGSKGALLVSAEGSFTAVPPSVSVRSTIGAGDSSIAGFLTAARDGRSAADRLCTAVAFGTAACMTEGSLPPLPDNIAQIAPQVTVTVL